MAKRLRLAKTLLKDTGVIFISIDDNEQAQLKLLCDDVFGEENFVANVIWKKKTNGNNMGHIPPVHDFIVVYARDAAQLNMPGIPVDEETINKVYKNPDNDERGPWTVSDLSANHVGPYFKLTNPRTGQEHWPPKGRYWVFNEEEVNRRIEDGRIIFGKSGDGRPVQRVFLRFRKSAGVRKPESWWDKHGLNSDASIELTDILGEAKAFAHPKPSITIRKILEFSTPPNALVLDFFAGSGTTLHAVMALNAEDGGNRRCILVTNNENNIAEEVCYERNRRVISGYTNSKGVHVPGLAGNALRYYRTALVGREKTLANKRALMRQATDLLCLKEGCYELVSAFTGVPSGHVPSGGVETQNLASLHASAHTRQQQIRLFTGPDARAMLLVYDPDAIDAAVALIGQLPVGAPTVRIKVYVFAPASYPFTDEFEAVADRVDLCALPDAIYQAFDQVFNALRA